MLSNIITTTRCVLRSCVMGRLPTYLVPRSLTTTITTIGTPGVEDKLEVIDINPESMFEDSDGDISPTIENPQSDDPEAATSTVDGIGGVQIAPVDIDPWVEEEEYQQEPLEIESETKRFSYPPIPEERLGSYQFQGIKVVLPKKLLKPETYRYRLDPQEEFLLADDIRVCRFDK